MSNPDLLPEALSASGSSAIRDVFFRVPEQIRLEVRREYCLLIDPRRGVFDVLHPMEAVLLSLLDGQTTLAGLAEMVATIYRVPRAQADALTTAALTKARPFLAATATPMVAPRRFDPKAYLVPGYQEPIGRGRPVETPLSMVLVPTWRCNFHCRYCYFGTGPQPGARLDRATALRVIHEAADLGVVTLYIGGGEPLLYPHLVDLVAAGKERGLLVSFSTNGSRLTAKSIRALRAAGLVSVQVSLDTAVPAVHDAVTQAPGTFPRVVAALRDLKAAGLYVRVRAVLTPETLPTVPELLDLLAELAVDEVDVGPTKCGSCEVEGAPLAAQLDPHTLAWLRQIAADRRGRFPEGQLRLSEAEAPWRSAADLLHCGNLTVSMVILPTGQASACEMIRFSPELCYGDVHAESLRDIWLGPRHRTLLATATDPAGIDPACARCVSLHVCRTGCMNRSRRTTGSFWGKDPRCPGPEAMSPRGEGEQRIPA